MKREKTTSGGRKKENECDSVLFQDFERMFPIGSVMTSSLTTGVPLYLFDFDTFKTNRVDHTYVALKKRDRTRRRSALAVHDSLVTRLLANPAYTQ